MLEKINIHYLLIYNILKKNNNYLSNTCKIFDKMLCITPRQNVLLFVILKPFQFILNELESKNIIGYNMSYYLLKQNGLYSAYVIYYIRNYCKFYIILINENMVRHSYSYYIISY